MLTRTGMDRPGTGPKSQPRWPSLLRRVGHSGIVDRVVVFGCAGSGKTTLARKLCARTGLTLVERDSLGVLGSESYCAAITKLICQPRWVLDGAPYYVEDLVYPVADTVVVLDYPKPVVMWRVLRRTLAVEVLRQRVGAHQPQGLAAWRDGEHPVRWAWSSYRDRHVEGLALMSRGDLAHAEIIRFRRPAAARRWLRQLLLEDHHAVGL